MILDLMRKENNSDVNAAIYKKLHQNWLPNMRNKWDLTLPDLICGKFQYIYHGINLRMVLDQIHGKRIIAGWCYIQEITSKLTTIYDGKSGVADDLMLLQIIMNMNTSRNTVEDERRCEYFASLTIYPYIQKHMLQ